MFHSFYLRRLFMPFFITFITLGVLQSIGSSSAQTGSFGNLDATPNGAFGACDNCDFRTYGIVFFTVPASSDFTVGSVTANIDNSFGSRPYLLSFYLFIDVNQRVNGLPLAVTPFIEVGPGARTTVSAELIGEDDIPITLNAGGQYALVLFGYDFVSNQEVYGGWRTGDAPPSGSLTYTSSRRVEAVNGVLEYYDLPAERHFMLEINPAGSLTFSPAPSGVAEGGAGVPMTINAAPVPTAAVTVPLSGDGQCELSTDNVTFTPSINVSIAAGASQGEFFIRAVDDAVYEGTHTCTISMGDPTSSNILYNVLTDSMTPSATITIADNEALPPPGITLTQSGGTTIVTEGGATDSFSLNLNSEPTAPVQIAILTDGQCSVSPTSLTFNTSGFLTPQNVTVTAVNDAVFEPSPHNCEIRFNVSSSDSRYNGRSIPALNVSINDNDPVPPVSFIITQTGGSTVVSEGGATDSYAIRMSAPPNGSVVIAVSTDGQCEVSVTSISFDDGNYGAPQWIDVSAVNDDVAEGNHTCTILYDTIIGNPSYVVDNTIVTVLDDDTAGFTLVESGGSTTVTEGGATDTLTVRLNTAPGQDVILALSTDGQCDVNPDTLTFNAANYDDVRTITVSASNDGVFEASPHPCTIFYDVITFDPAYINVEVFNTNVSVIDFVPPPPAAAGVTITQSGGSTDVTEGGATDTLALRLNSAPAAPVQIVVTTDAQCSAAPTTLTFDGTSYASEQTVTITAVDDAVQESTPHACVISFAVTSADGDYNGLVVPDVTANVTDDDAPLPPPAAAGVTVTQSGGSTDVTEGGATDTLALRLNSAPAAPVQIVVTTDAQCSAAPTTLTFDGTSYASDQTVTITAVDDAVQEATPHACVISFAVTSADGDYNGLVVPDVTANVTDDDTPLPPPPPPGGGSNPPAATLPPPPPTPLCEDHNFSESGVVRSGVADLLRPLVNCRVLYQNGAPTTWLNSDLYTSGSIGSEGVMALGVQQAIDIFSPSGLTYFNGGAVFCLRGSGYLIWLAARGMPRHAEIIGSYRVPEFPGFTCATLFEPGTLVLVSRLPEGVNAP